MRTWPITRFGFSIPPLRSVFLRRRTSPAPSARCRWPGLVLLGLGLWLPLAAPVSGAQTDYADLTEAMEDLNGAYRRLGRQVKQAEKNASSLELLATVRAAAAAALDFVPALIEEAPADQRTELIAGYKEGMQRLLAAVDDLEAALKAGDNAKAAEIVEAMKDIRNQEHKKYKKPD